MNEGTQRKDAASPCSFPKFSLPKEHTGKLLSGVIKCNNRYMKGATGASGKVLQSREDEEKQPSPGKARKCDYAYCVKDKNELLSTSQDRKIFRGQQITALYALIKKLNYLYC